MARDIEVVVLGCGGSGGTPFATGYWGNCDPHNPKNRRTRPSIAIRTARTCVVIDTGPDFREQTLRQNIGNIDAVLYTHPHSDHVNGMDDLRYVAIKKRIDTGEQHRIPIYCDQNTMVDLKSRFPYMFKTSDDGLYVPLVNETIIEMNKSLKIGDIEFLPFEQTHGSTKSIGYRVGDVTYSTDVSKLDQKALDAIKGTKIWIVDCGQYGSDEITVHANYDCVMEWNKYIGAEKIYLTHITPRHDYETVNANTPDFVECAYDGMKISARF